MNKSKWFVACLVVIALALAFLIAAKGRLSRTKSVRQQAVETTNGLSAANRPGPAKPASAATLTRFNAQSGAAQNTNSRVVATPFQGRQPVNVDSAFSEFGFWSQRYMAAPTAADKALLEAEGVALAKARREALSILIRSNPRRALELSAPWKIRNALPSSIATQLEERSEEHTSELQSRENLVCRLLLEKKKNFVKKVVDLCNRLQDGRLELSNIPRRRSI